MRNMQVLRGIALGSTNTTETWRLSNINDLVPNSQKKYRSSVLKISRLIPREFVAIYGGDQIKYVKHSVSEMSC
jgi:hypothetical protein